MSLLWAGFLIGCVFGVAARLGRFCLLRGLRQTLALDGEQRSGAPALQAFALALATALLMSQLLAERGQIDLTTAQVVRSSFSWFGALIGGLLFGGGMALARSCGARSLVLLAGGNLRSLVTLLCLGAAAQASLTGVLVPARQWVQGFGKLSLEHATLPARLLANGFSATATLALATGLPVLALLFYALRKPELRRSPVQWIAALVIGALVAAGWWITAYFNFESFEPVPLTSLSFVGPVAEGQLYLQLAVGRAFSLGPAMVAGTLVGAFVAALLSRTARLEGFDGASRMLASATGGLLMGFGGVLAVGCSIGQGLTGLSTLAFASFPAVAGIVIGALATLALQARTPFGQQGSLQA
ncbi:YeeE/YedE family protein [Diaphorobacter aerolatus]|uniref:YeeE/YedE family protein n=1 Tax=Diaphorobacter aerolatus TaxID=1288495 RepID=A0A7H0GMU6_9BURK|nr:YeeE/YedE family protein [Diaphorobacter aerolatus]QNP49612.1 YeeE/YedE family protein [Diaphorobacter aerolatus]